MAQVVADDLRVCEDCAQIIANGEIDDGTDTGETIAAAQVTIWGDDAIGLVLACDGDDDESCDTFSSQPCDGCGSHLAGSRHAAAVLR